MAESRRHPYGVRRQSGSGDGALRIAEEPDQATRLRRAPADLSPNVFSQTLRPLKHCPLPCPQQDPPKPVIVVDSAAGSTSSWKPWLGDVRRQPQNWGKSNEKFTL